MTVESGAPHCAARKSLARRLRQNRSMEALLWIMLISGGALCIHIWTGQFGKQFPDRGRRVPRIAAVEQRQDATTPGRLRSVG